MRGAGRAVALLLMLQPAACGPSASPHLVESESNASSSPAARVANRWEEVAGFNGTGGETTREFEIAAGSLQWRAKGVYSGRRLEVRIAGEAEPLVTPECPGSEFGFSIDTGKHALEIMAEGPWEITVDQQLNTPVAEPALKQMTAENLIAVGTFYGIDREGTGKAMLYEFSGGRLALRFEPFRVTSNSDLFVWVSRNHKPRTSEDAFASEHVEVAALKSTGGAQNYVLPPEVAAGDIRSVIIWCEPIKVAYAAASMERR